MLSKNYQKRILAIACFVLPVVLILFSLFVGRYDLSFSDILSILIQGQNWNSDLDRAIEYSLIYDIRLPRALLAFIVGGALSISGGALQGMFRNPLVDSGMLGVSAGSGFGACLGIIIFHNFYMTYVLAFCFGILAVLLSYFAGKIYDSAPTVTLVLGGVVISAIFSALISFMKFVADPMEQLPTITFWLMGSLARANFSDMSFALIPIIIGVAGIVLIRWRINVLSLGDKEASTLGVNTGICRAIIIICTAIATAGAVCVSGTIGWVGLIIPHIVRMLVGNDNRVLLPVCISAGGCFLLIVDLIARSIVSTEIPLGVLTALIGGPFFILILKRTKGGGSW
ncbi:iron ABC transporter permease [Dehalobacter sp. DCM]|uniref:FecCD family ABC transporter permease n=1 Tax=Dehalobacter sp. DCM TaxID=2907827 RepID=UPI0030814FB0|nr:iron ABC transporter permease [Dehalobacter sp. DCM]